TSLRRSICFPGAGALRRRRGGARELGEDRRDALSGGRKQGSDSDGHHAGHQRVLDHVLTARIFPNAQAQSPIEESLHFRLPSELTVSYGVLMATSIQQRRYLFIAH